MTRAGLVIALALLWPAWLVAQAVAMAAATHLNPWRP